MIQNPLASPLFRAILSIGAATVVVRFVSIIKELKVAQTFGVGDELDAFIVAFIIPTFFLNVAVGALYSSLVPSLINAREREGAESARQIFSIVLIVLVVILTIAAASIHYANEFIVRALFREFSSAKADLTIAIANELVFIIVPNGVTLACAAAVNSTRRFKIVAFIPIITPVVIIFILIVTINANNITISKLVNGTIIGVLFECIVSIILVGRQGLIGLPVISRVKSRLRDLLIQYIPLLFGSLIMGGTVLTDQVFVGALDPGSVSALNYANKIPALISGLAAAAVGTAILPYMSQHAANGELAELRTIINRYCIISLVSLSVAVIAIMSGSNWIVSIAFERGKFTHRDTEIVANIMLYALPQVPFYVIGTLLARALSSIRSNDVLLYVSVFSFMSNIIINYVAIKFLGAAGVALSTSITYACTCIINYYFLTHRIRRQLWMSRSP